MISSPLLAAPSVPSSPLQSWLASAPACAAAKSAGCLCSHSAADLRALRHDWHRSALAALAAHTPLAHSASDRCAIRQAAHADPVFLGMSVLNPQHVNVHSSSLFTACLHSSTIATRLSETRRKHAARAVPAAVESDLRLAPRCPAPRGVSKCGGGRCQGTAEGMSRAGPCKEPRLGERWCQCKH